MDFAAALVVAAVDVKSDEDSLAAPDLLKALCHYVEWRYHNELGLALEMLCYLGESCHVQLRRPSQFWRQVSWIADQFDLTPEEYQSLNIPAEYRHDI